MKGLGLFLVLASLGAASCGDSGQTGSPSPTSPSCAGPCQCEYLVSFHLAKATVLAVEQDQVTLRVDQLLNAQADDEQYEQREIQGTYQATTSLCTAKLFDLPHPGDVVFATFAISGADKTRLLLRVQPWSDEVALVDGSLVSLAEAVQLSDASTCYARYAAPCNDTPHNDTPHNDTPDGSCAVSQPHSLLGAPREYGAAALLLAFVTLLRRRRAQRF
jgi:hypothetical protein